MKKNKGFTLVELMVYTAIFTISVIVLIGILVLVTGIQVRQSASAEVGQQGQFLLQQIQYYVANARIVNMTQDVATSTLSLGQWQYAINVDQTISLSSGTVYTNSPLTAPLTSNKVRVSQLSFTRHVNLSSAAVGYGTDSVTFSFTMSATSTNGAQYTQTFQSSASVLSPVSKIVLAQQSAILNPNLTWFYGDSVATGSLLLIVTSYVGAGSTSSISDSGGNTWVLIASTTDSSVPQHLLVFAATNAKGSPPSESIRMNYGTHPTYGSLFLYEYRGLSTSTSLDTSSSQLQSNNQSPSSGLVNPTSTLELLFGVSYGYSIPPSLPGPGFTLETTSSQYLFSSQVQISVEDKIQYITGPVSSSWQFGGPVTSTALILTFK